MLRDGETVRLETHDVMGLVRIADGDLGHEGGEVLAEGRSDLQLG